MVVMLQPFLFATSLQQCYDIIKISYIHLIFKIMNELRLLSEFSSINVKIRKKRRNDGKRITAKYY